MRICQPPENVSLGFSRSVGREAEAAQHRRDLQIDAVALAPAELFLQLAVARQHRGVLRFGLVLVAEAFFERGDLGAHVEQRLERQAGLLDAASARVAEPVLRQVADRQPGRLDDEPAVGFFEPGQHLQQRRLAGAVGPAQADTLAVVDLPADRVEQHAVAERFGKGGKLNHGDGRSGAQAEVSRNVSF